MLQTLRTGRRGLTRAPNDAVGLDDLLALGLIALAYGAAPANHPR